jgi:hypothetical protein
MTLHPWCRLCRTFAVALVAVLLGAPCCLAQSKAPGLGDPGALKSLSLDTGRSGPNGFTLSGRDAGQQLIVTGNYASGQVRDLTHQAKYEVSPEGIVTVEPGGYVAAVQEGQATIRVVAPEGKTATATVTVTDILHDRPVNFANEVVPIFTKLGCNAGGCHGKAEGQNGFKLSLLGFEPAEDYEFIVKEGRGRRVFPAAPDHSLLLLKATARIAHGGGKRLEPDSPAYRLLRRWIEQGVPYGRPDDPVVEGIGVWPRQRLLPANGSQQLTVVAHYSDGSTRDVTRMTQFEPNVREMAEVSATGQVKTRELTGTVAVMARYQAQVDVFRGTIPLGVTVDNLPAAKNFIDELVFARLKKLGLPPSEVCDDGVFLRRATLDICGRLPTLEETREFLAEASANKRDKLIDRLLASEDYGDFFANKWGAILRNKRDTSRDDPGPTFAFHAWIRDNLKKNLPYDQFVRAILTASGEEVKNPPVAWYREVHEPSLQTEDTAQLFLGLRIACARCHHHPFEKWSQQDYYGFSAFFSQVGYKNHPKDPPPAQKGKKKKKKKKGKPPPRPPLEVFHQEGKAQAIHPKTGEAVKPAGLGGEPLDIPAKVDPRTRLADWMTAPDNPFFARVLVNRYWKHFFGRGLVDPEDDMRVTNPASNPELLTALAQHFVQSKYDLKDLVRTLCTSRVYQLSARSNAYNREDRQNFSRFVPRRLHAEVLLDAIDQVTESQTRFGGVPAGTRAVQLPDNAFESYFLSVFGRPDASSACECERDSSTSLPQLLHLINSADILGKTAGSRAQKLSRDRRPHEERLRDLYLVALSREPGPEEVKVLTTYIDRKGKDVKGAYEDIIWALINGEEFLFNH